MYFLLFKFLKVVISVPTVQRDQNFDKKNPKQTVNVFSKSPKNVALLTPEVSNLPSCSSLQSTV